MKVRPYFWQLFLLLLCLAAVLSAGVYTHAKEGGAPKIRAEVVGQKTGEHRIQAEKLSTVIETIHYRNFVPGLKYTVCGRLAERTSGVPLRTGKKEVTNRVSFTPRAPDGNVKIPFTFDATAFSGKEVVLFDDILCSGTRILSVCEPENEARTFLISGEAK